MMGIYTPRGAALEYAPLAVNLFKGCTHGCRYCYVPGVLRMDRAAFHARAEWRLGILDQIRRDVKRLKDRGQVDRVHLCFTCDPYVAGGEPIVREALEILHFERVPVSILTKGGERATRDLHLLASMDVRFGVSLSWASDAKRAEWEPGAAPVHDRVESLRLAREWRIPTWASVEPVIDPAEALAAIDLLLPVADAIKVGRWNHDRAANAIDWTRFARAVLARVPNERLVLKRGLAELVQR